jgi:hypothetical protein
MTNIYTIAVFSALGSFAGALLGSLIGCRLAWRKDFVTREEAIKLARAIDEQHRIINELSSGAR